MGAIMTGANKILGIQLFLAVLGLLAVMPLEGQPRANFSISPSSGCSPLQVSFKDLSTGSVKSYHWRFGNGNSSSKENPGAIYINSGNYNVTLVVEDSLGRQDSLTKKNAITVFTPPTGDFVVSVTQGCNPLSVALRDTSQKGSAGIASYTWDMGDGTVKTKKDFTHIYTISGKYDIALVVIDSNGCKDQVTKKGVVKVLKLPAISFAADTMLACSPPFKVKFSDTATSTAAITGYKYTWFFGDGNYAITSQKVYTHTYQGSGQFDVSLAITDSSGCSDTLTKPAYIKIQKVKANFSFSPHKKGCTPFKIIFNNLTNPANSGNQYLWKFGDGSISHATNPNHNYTSSGIYSPTLIVNSPAGCVDSISKYDSIVVKTGPTVDFSVSDTFGCQAPFAVTFKDTVANATSWKWNFGDGNQSSASNPVHTYQDTGVFSVSLQVTSPSGCKTTLSKDSLVIVSPPVAGFIPSASGGCNPVTINFTDTSKTADSIVSWQWNFGDGYTSSQQNPSHNYDSLGTFPVKLKITTANGCADSVTYHSIRVGLKPNANFYTPSIRKGCINDLVIFFKDSSNSYTVKPDSFYWQFGDGGTSNLENPVYKYRADSGFYTVSLTVWNNGCQDSMQRTNYIQVLPPHAKFDAIPIVCHEDSLTMIDNSVGATGYMWRFGDGDSTSQQSPAHHFADTGHYTITLITSNKDNGCTDTATKNIYVPEKFKAQIIGVKTRGCQGDKFVMKAKSNRPGATYIWDFGDGDSAFVDSAIHVYSQPGLYSITLTAISPDSCVKYFYAKDFIKVYGPQVKFSIVPKSGCTPLRTLFIDSSQLISSIVSKQWIFGDGDTANTLTNSEYHTYQQPPYDQNKGYQAQLILQDSFGCRASQTVTVLPTHPDPEFSWDTILTCGNYTFVYKPLNADSAGFGTLQRFWQFHDGTSSMLKSPSHSYTKSGQYKTTLILTDSNNCRDTLTKSFTINIKKPKAAFSVNSSSAPCPPLVCDFTDKSTDGNVPVSNWKWHFGDGSSAQKQNPQKVYLKAGKFTVSLVVIDSIGCTDTAVYPDLIDIGGPLGTYTIDTSEGCQPLTVHFTATVKNAINTTWDLGNGNLLKGDTISYTYKNPGSFIPLLILSDNQGCTYTLPPKDTIDVHALPQANFGFKGACFGYPTKFYDQSKSNGKGMKYWYWRFGDGSIGNGPNPMHIYQAPGNYKVVVHVINKNNCEDSTNKIIHIGGLKADFDAKLNKGCVGSVMHFNDQTNADTTIKNWQWIFGDGKKSNIENPSHIYANKGQYDVSLIVNDVAGCADTAIKYHYQIIGDSSIPLKTDIYRVTVADNHTVQIDFSKFPDFDFRQYEVYRAGNPGNFSQLATVDSINDTSYFDHSTNTLNQSYCYKVLVANLCHQQSKISETPKHCTVELEANPDTNRITLNWNKYIGWNKIKKYDIYRLDNVSGNFVTLDSVPGTITTYIDSDIHCSPTHYYRVKAFEDGGYSQLSWSDTAGATPPYVPNIPKADLIRATVVNNQVISLKWQDTTNFQVNKYEAEKSMDGYHWKPVHQLFDSAITSYIDSTVNVDQRPYYYRIKMLDNCGDTGLASNIGKTIFLQVDTSKTGRPLLNWTKYKQWKDDVKYYDVERLEPDGSFSMISQTATGEDTVYQDKISTLNGQSQYCYRITAHSSGKPGQPSKTDITSTSNVACAPVTSTLYIPTAFTPNGDGLNDSFKVMGTYIYKYHLQIYDRWGTKVFESHSLNNSWDGRFRGKIEDGVYLFLIHATGADSKMHVFSGSVTVIR